MKHFLLYGHGGSYNHGEEAIVKTTINLIRKKYQDAYIAISSHFPEQDKVFMVNADVFFSPVPKLWVQEKLTASQVEKAQLAREMYASALSFITPETICLSVGGDNFCYPNWHRLAVFQEKASQVQARSILWGCSVEPSAITSDMLEVLNSYTLILARESCTYNALRDIGIKTEVKILPDPAFFLEPQKIELPVGFHENEIVGVNISPLVMRREIVPDILKENIVNLIEFVLTETNMKLLLLPHVTMPMDNDSVVLREIMEALPEKSRSRIWLAGEKYSAAELKYAISMCRVLVCARTHASIAAYSSGVPVIVIGYSVKSKGIANDLGVGELAINISEIKSPNAIKEMFIKSLEMQENKTVFLRKSQDCRLKVNQYHDYI